MNTQFLPKPIRHFDSGFAINLTCFLALCLSCATGSAEGRTPDRLRADKPNAPGKAAKVRLSPESNPAVQAKQARAAKYPRLVQRLESRLIDAWQQANAAGVEKSVAALQASGIRLQDQNVIVLVECGSTTDPKEVAAGIVAKNGIVVRTGKSHVKAAVPLPALEAVASLPGVAFVRVPPQKRRFNTILSQGRGVTGATNWHGAGLTGQGVKVAVIDTGFANLATLKAQDEIPASAIEMDFSGAGMTTGTDSHGSACAEIVYDVAPGCQLYLIRAFDPSDDEAAVNYCKTQGVHIISYSTGYDVINFYDGTANSALTPHPINIVNDAAANGILWVNSAGNDQVQHALIQWHDADADGNLDWDSTFYNVNELWYYNAPIPTGEQLDIYLTWNNWPATSQDFDLYLYRWDGSGWSFVTSSVEEQNGTQPPTEEIHYTTTVEAFYGILVAKYSATSSPWFILRSRPFELFFYGYENTTNPAPGSVANPGDAAQSFTVGAVHYTNYASGPIEWFSSLGPNNGAYTGNPSVVKPDICGPDYVSTATYGAGGFGGTSPAAPHIAALAALVKSLYPSYTNIQLRAYLERYGRDLGTPGKDNTYGSGPCVLPSPVIVNFTGAPTNGAAPLAVAFTNLCSGATNYTWNFGDGKTSAAANPTNVYTNAGNYTVSLTAIGAGGTNVLTRTSYIAATNPPRPVLTWQYNASGKSLTFTWSGSGFHLQAQTNTLGIGIPTNWYNYPGGMTSPVIITNNPANPSVFYRLVWP